MIKRPKAKIERITPSRRSPLAETTLSRAVPTNRSFTINHIADITAACRLLHLGDAVLHRARRRRETCRRAGVRSGGSPWDAPHRRAPHKLQREPRLIRTPEA